MENYEKEYNLKNTKYRQNAVRPIQNNQVKEISNKLNLDLNDEEIKEFEELSKGFLETWNFTYFYKTTIPKSEYLRSPITSYNEPDNCLYYKCEIKGKPNKKLSGLRLVVKDTVFIAGMPLMNGSHVLEGFSPVEDATIIKRLLDNGITIVGKSNNEDLCFSGSSITCVKGPVENSLIKGGNAGGSSSGSALAINRGLCDISIAGDQGGSIRIPAAYNGLIGFKPTFGLIPYTGILGIEYTFDHVGPIAKTIYDVSLFMNCTAGPDDHDQRYYTYLKYSQFNSDACDILDSNDDVKEENYSDTYPNIVFSSKKKSEFEKSIKYGTNKIRVDYCKAIELYKEIIPELKVAFLKEGVDNVSLEIKEARANSLNLLKTLFKEKHNIVIEEVSVPEHDLSAALSLIYFIEGYYANLNNDFVNKNNFNKENYELAKTFFTGSKCHKDLSNTNKLFMILGYYIKEKYGSRFYAKAQDIRKELLISYFKVFRNYDLLLMPTVPGLPKEIPNNDLSIKDYFNTCLGSAIPNTDAYNLTGFPALTINFNKLEKICPVMIVGRHFEDHRVLQFGKLIEELLVD